MEFVYMGIFSTVFKWVFDKILSPVFSFVAKLVSTVLTFVFNNVLMPLLTAVFKPLILLTFSLLKQIWCGVLLSIFTTILKVIDYLGTAFDYMTGISDVVYKNESMPLLDAVFSVDGLRKAYLIISFIGLGIALMLTIYATVKSTLDLDFENKRPVSHVLSQFFKCVVNLFLFQLIIIFVIKLSGLVLRGINTAMNNFNANGTSSTIGRMIFTVTTMDACKINPDLNISGKDSASVAVDDSIRKFFYSSETRYYVDTNTIKKFFDIVKIDYLLGLILSIAMVIIMAVCLVIFVQRLFDMLLLYIVSPFFVAMIPLDDGEKFSRWKEAFIGKTFSGFGMIIGMKLYLMLCPVIVGGQMKFSVTSTEMDYLAKMVFLIGGAWAVLKSGGLVTSLLSQSAGMEEAQTSAMVSGAAGNYLMGAASKVTNTVKSAAFKGLSSLGKGVKDARNKSRSEFEAVSQRGKQQAFSASGWNSGIVDKSKAKSNFAIGTHKLPGSGLPKNDNRQKWMSASKGLGKPNSGLKLGSRPSWNEAGHGIGNRTSDIEIGNRPYWHTAQPTSDRGKLKMGSNPGFTKASPSSRFRKSNIKIGNELDKVNTFNPANKVESIKDSGNLRIYRNAEGKKVYGFRVPGIAKFGYDKDGNYNYQMFGMGFKTNNGKLAKVNLPVVSFKYDRNGDRHTSKVSALGLNMRANTQTGKLYMKDFAALGIHRELDSQGEAHTTNVFGGLITRQSDNNGNYHFTNFANAFTQEKQADGQFHVTSAGFGAYKEAYSAHLTDSSSVSQSGSSGRQSNVKVECAGVRMFGMNFGLHSSEPGKSGADGASGQFKK